MKTSGFTLLLTLAILNLMVACAPTDKPTVTNAEPIQPAAAVITQPESAWRVQDPDVNPIDGVKTQIVETTGTGLFNEKLVLLFKNGRFSPKSVALGVFTDKMVAPVGGEYGEYETQVRVKFDEEKPLSQTWGIADNHDTLFPNHREAQFLAQILKHKKLIVEFAYYEQTPHVVTFNLTGLAESLNAAGLKTSAAK